MTEGRRDNKSMFSSHQEETEDGEGAFQMNRLDGRNLGKENSTHLEQNATFEPDERRSDE